MLLLHQRTDYFFGYDLFEKGVMPEAGGWNQQPAHWMQAFQVIRVAAAEVTKPTKAPEEEQ